MRVIMYEPNGRGGHALYTLRLVNALAQDGCTVHLCTTHDYAYRDRLSPSVDLVDVLAPRRWMQANRLTRAFRQIVDTGRRNRLVKQLGPEVIHLQVVYPALDWWALRWLRSYNKPSIVITVHNVIPHEASWFRSPEVVRQSYSLASGIVVHSTGLARKLSRDFALEVPISVIPFGPHVYDGIRVTRSAARESLGIPQSAYVVLLFGVLRPNKGLLVALGGLQHIGPGVPVRLLVAGSASAKQRTQVQRLVTDLGVRDRVDLHLGYVPDSKVAYYYGACNVVALPYTSFEAQSGVLIDAYAFERPVIVSNVGALGETVREDRTGLVIEKGDAGAFAQAIRDAYNMQLGIEENNWAMRTLVETKYSWRAAAARTISFYNEILRATV